MTAESGSNYNSTLNPQEPQDLWVTVSQTIQGSSNSGALAGCPSGSYNWDYQANLFQGPELSHSWIQQVIEISQSGNSCYTIEFWPDYYTTGFPYFDSFSIAPSSILYEAASSSDIGFSMSYTGGPPYTVTAFYLSACCSSNGNTITWAIYPDQLQYNGVALNSPIEFDQNSQENFNIVGTGSRATATFSAGSGQINYCSYINPGSVGPPQTGEQSNMLYSALTQSVCGSGNLRWFYQSFNPGALPAPSVTVQSVDQNNNQITGYYTVLYSGGSAINSGFTPVTFTDIFPGAEYSVGPEDYGSCSFNYWQDTGNTTQDRSFYAYGSQTFTAVYNCNSAASVTVQTVNQNGVKITGYYVGLYNSGGTLINSGFSWVTFTGLSVGTTYSVEPDNYGSCTFNHWQDTGSTTRDRSFTAASTQTFTAVYECT